MNYAKWVGMTTVAVMAAAFAGTALMPGAAVNITQTPSATEKAKVVQVAYPDGSAFRKAWVLTYADGPVGRQNVYTQHSFDQGASWSAPSLLSRDATGAMTGGQGITVRNGLGFVADNDKPNIFGAATAAGPAVVITWTSAYCPANAGAGNNAGSYNNTQQGAGDLNGDGVADRPYYCVWTATTQDPALGAWNVQQLTNGQRDAIGDVVAGNATGTAFALAWQEDPAGLQPGEAEGPGDGGSGATVSGGTNIWYTHAPTPNTTTLLANVAQVSDNSATGVGQPGASRPNLQISGSTAVLAYEETACAGGTGGRCIVYHAFPYAAHDTNAAGTVVSDPVKNARRVRFVLQGATAAGASPLRTLLLWRESATGAPGAPADIVVRRGLIDTARRPGSTGFLPSDILADTPQALTRVAASGGNANAHRAIVRGSTVVIAFDQTPDMAAADPERTVTPTANYNLHVTRSTADGGAGSWSAAVNLSRITSAAVNVVEPRLVPTPGTIVNPLTGTPDAGDTQDTNVLYVSFATAANTRAAAAGRVYVARSTDQGATFEPFVPVSAALAGESEAQLRAAPDGASVAVLWMSEQTPGDTSTKDAMFTTALPIHVPDLRLTASDTSFGYGEAGHVTFTLFNHGTAIATNVVITGTLPRGLLLQSVNDSACTVTAGAFRCIYAQVAAGQRFGVVLTVKPSAAGVYLVRASATTDTLESSTLDNVAEATVKFSSGGGCSLARGASPLDPSLLLLVAFAVAAMVLRAWRR